MNILKRLSAIAVAAVMSVTIAVPVSAKDFVDPRDVLDAYLAQKKGSTSSSVDTSQSDTDISESVSDDNSEEVTDDTPADDTPKEESTKEENPESDKSSKVKTPATSVKIYSAKSKLYVGDSFKISYKITPAKSDDIVYVKTSNSKVLSVDSNGVVTGLKEGLASITISTGSGKKDKVYISVKKPPEAESSDPGKVQKIELMHKSLVIYKGESTFIKYMLFPEGAEDKVTFSSSNMAVAKVSDDGLITGMGVGTSVITIKCSSGPVNKLVVSVVEEGTIKSELNDYEIEYDSSGNPVVSKIAFEYGSVSIKKGNTVTPVVNTYPEDISCVKTFTSSDTSVAKVSSSGKIKAVAPGSAVITVTTDNGKSDSITVTVYGEMLKGIDVSKWNGDIKWKKVKASGMADFCMIRASYGYEDTDPKLDENVKGCEKYDIPYGFYHYLYATNVTEAKKEVRYFLNAISDYSPDYPVVLDIEEAMYDNLSRKQVTDIVVTFMEELEDAGYYAMIYSYAKFFDDNLDMDRMKDYDIWVACWGDDTKLDENFSYSYGIWQYSETGKISGIPEYVDLNYCYKDYADIISEYGLNGK